MLPAPQWMREPSDEVPGIALITHQLSASDSSEIFIDSIKVYLDRIYLRMGVKFREPESWRAAAIDPNILMTPETFHATTRYRDGETVPAFSYTSGKIVGENTATSSSNTLRRLVQFSSEGAGLQWYVDYLIFPVPTEDVVFSAEFPRIGLVRGEWVLPKSTIEEGLKIGSRYASARKAAKEEGYIIKTNLNSVAEIAARLAHLGARVDFGNAKFGWEPIIQVPLQKREALSIHKILSGDAIKITIKGLDADCYLLEVPNYPATQIIALRNDVARVAEVLIAGLHK